MDYTSTTHTIAWFRDRYREGALDLKPPYQRNPVWQERQKCSLVETILKEMPIPEIFVEVDTSAQGEQEWGVIDGQQRIRAILQFMGNELDPNEQDFNEFPLDKLDAQSPWSNMKFRELSPDDRRRFWETSLAVRELRPANEEEVKEMFRRLNKYQIPLNDQELRNATYSGPFMKLALQLADDEYWAENRTVSPALIRRMIDIEFVSELVIGVMHGPQGGSGKIIDDYYATYEDYEDEFPQQRRTVKLFRKTLATIQEVLPDIKETRLSNKTDFYTLFVGFAQLLRSAEPPTSKTKKRELAKKLQQFAEEIDQRVSDETADVPQHAIEYAEAVKRGPNVKTRRAKRQAALLEIVEPYFKRKAPKH